MDCVREGDFFDGRWNIEKYHQCRFCVALDDLATLIFLDLDVMLFTFPGDNISAEYLSFVFSQDRYLT